MKKFMNLKVKTWELVVICVILASVVLRPNWLIQLNQTLIGKVILLVGLVAASLHKPYMGLLVLLLIVSLGFYREGLGNACSNQPEKLCIKPCEWSKPKDPKDGTEEICHDPETVDAKKILDSLK